MESALLDEAENYEWLESRFGLKKSRTSPIPGGFFSCNLLNRLVLVAFGDEIVRGLGIK